MHEGSASVLAIIAISSLACNSGKPPSSVCASDGDCESGTQCLAVEVTGPTGSCTPSTSMTCTQSCGSNSDCSALVDPANSQHDFSCVICGTGTGTCAVVEGSTLLPVAGVCEQTAECSSGLSCLAAVVGEPDGGCGPASTKTCTINCATTADCSTLVDPTNQQHDLSCLLACGGAQGICVILN